MRLSSFIFQAGLIISLAAAAPGAIVVGGLTDIWLAGQPDGTDAGGFGGDTAPGNSPVLVHVLAGDILTFAVVGSTSVGDGCFAATPDGGCLADVSLFGTGPALGIGSYMGPANALIAVFLDGNVPAGLGGPASLDFTANTNFASLSPLLNQIFFIGNGLTAGGSVQQFVAPAGATRLFLASADALGANFNNEGFFEVEVSGASGVPEPATWALLGGGLALAATRRRRQ